MRKLVRFMATLKIAAVFLTPMMLVIMVASYWQGEREDGLLVAQEILDEWFWWRPDAPRQPEPDPGDGLDADVRGGVSCSWRRGNPRL